MESARATVFRGELAELGRETLAGFVADLWSVRGYEILDERESEVVVESSSGGHRSLLICPRSRRFVLGCLVGRHRLKRADAVVTSRENVLLERITTRTETELVGPEALYQLATYATDAQQESTLYRDYFGGSPLMGSGPGGSHISGHSEGHGSGRSTLTVQLPIPPRRYVSVRNVSILLCCVLVLAGIVSAHSIRPPETQAPAATDGSGQPFLTTATAEDNVSVLLTRHEAILDGQSPDLFIVHDGTRGGIVSQRRWAWSRQRLLSERGHAWRFEVSGELKPATIGSKSPRVRLVTGVAGDTCSTRSVNPADASIPIDPCSSLADDTPPTAVGELTRVYLSRYLSESSLRVADRPAESGDHYELTSSDPPPGIAPRVRNYSARAVVTAAGVVEEFDVSYRLPTDGRHERRSLSLRIENYSSRGIPG